LSTTFFAAVLVCVSKVSGHAPLLRSSPSLFLAFASHRHHRSACVSTASTKLEKMSEKIALTKYAVKSFFWFSWGVFLVAGGHKIGDCRLKQDSAVRIQVREQRKFEIGNWKLETGNWKLGAGNL